MSVASWLAGILAAVFGVTAIVYMVRRERAADGSAGHPPPQIGLSVALVVLLVLLIAALAAVLAAGLS